MIDGDDVQDGRPGYAGPASLVVGDVRHVVRVRLTGSINPFDGHYHWQGTVYDAPAEVRSGSAAARLCVADVDVAARLVERTAGGHLMISGTGRPPFPL
ncbi:DUF4873 domain-containing protein [Mycolicibacterium obuense]|uniref:DUF4873 domain-containing protein n=1 Tax=Mycolicibacterium obuense TaxID=1807 RepID=A0A0J6WC12_9MYCO|nr:DUF4873 domain-containing protein [Mycolicibacterium obuense]KMO79488.1 hypothetical protein MOBUDSM44075_01289 [Mycolicibacterium obuense]OKH68752.1 hypothetical protein EB72_00390 [Mycobacterium sp. SWH-M1]